VLFVIWVATGIGINEHNASTIDWPAEALNEASKMCWGLAFLLGARSISRVVLGGAARCARGPAQGHNV